MTEEERLRGVVAEQDSLLKEQRRTIDNLTEENRKFQRLTDAQYRLEFWFIGVLIIIGTLMITQYFFGH